MKAKLFAVVLGSSLLLGSSVLRAGDTNTTSQPTPPPPHRDGPPRGMGSILPPQMVEKLNLTEDQKAKLKPIEESFAKAQQEYIAAHKDEIDAARKAMETAMVGLQEQRKAAMEQVKSLLTPEQMALIQSKRGEGREPAKEHGAVKPPPE